MGHLNVSGSYPIAAKAEGTPMHGAIAMSKKIRPMTPVQAVKRAVREAEKADRAKGDNATGASGFVLLRFVSKPIAWLIENKKIGPEEFQAAGDIVTAFMSMAGALMLRPHSLERLDRGRGDAEPAAVIDAQARYREWADYWSREFKLRRDRTLRVVIAAVVDEHPL